MPVTKDAVLSLLTEADGYLSGQEMSRRLQVSRAAVWKAVEALRAEGYAVESATNRGYRLAASPDRLTAAGVLAALGEHPWADRVSVLESVDSTNTLAKKLAAGGAPHGTVLIADRQTAGRGRLGRSFASPSGVGVYLSVILRPEAPPRALMHLTAMAAVAVSDAAEAAAGVRPAIKWTNDLILQRRKCAGILTELSLQAESGLVDYAVVGIGTNCNHGDGDFPPDVRPMAVSLREAAGRPVDRCRYAAALIRRLYQMDQALLSEARGQWMAQYAARCITVGQDVLVVAGGTSRRARADGIDPDGALLVTWEDGSRGVVSSGEVSVRGMYGYL